MSDALIALVTAGTIMQGQHDSVFVVCEDA